MAKKTPIDPADRAIELRDQIRRADKMYYEEDAPELSDADYDALMRELRAIEEQESRTRHARFANSDSARRGVNCLCAGKAQRANDVARQRV